MYQPIISLSNTEASLLTRLAARGKQIFDLADARDAHGAHTSPRGTVNRLVAKGWLERIERGKYLIVPLEAGPGRTWSEDPHVIARHLASPVMISYWSALHYWNLSEQIPRVTYVQTTVRRENRSPTILGMRFRFVRVKPARFFGGYTYRSGESQVEVTDREKTIIDCLDRPDLSGGVPEAGGALLAGDGDFDWERMTPYLRRFGSGAVVKRLGFLVEHLALAHPPEPQTIAEWLKLLTAGISDLDPSSSAGSRRIVTRWRIRVNLPVEGLRRRR